MFVCCKNGSSLINLIYSGQPLFSYSNVQMSTFVCSIEANLNQTISVTPLQRLLALKQTLSYLAKLIIKILMK
jgi:hypothetical protein